VNVYIKTLKKIWQIAIRFVLLRFLLMFLERHINLRTELKTEFGVKNNAEKNDIEALATNR